MEEKKWSLKKKEKRDIQENKENCLLCWSEATAIYIQLHGYKGRGRNSKQIAKISGKKKKKKWRSKLCTVLSCFPLFFWLAFLEAPCLHIPLPIQLLLLHYTQLDKSYGFPTTQLQPLPYPKTNSMSCLIHDSLLLALLCRAYLYPKIQRKRLFFFFFQIV